MPDAGNAGNVARRLVHLDTDFGGDPDDACALAMLLGWPGVEISGITTTIDPDGMRAAHVRHMLALAGRSDIPVAAGAAVSLTTHEVAEPFRGAPYWPPDLPPVASPPGAALDLLAQSIASGAQLIAIGPLTNLALLALLRPQLLRGVPLTLMGGWLQHPAPDLPQWGAEMDFNVQWDTQSAQIVAASGAALTLVPIAAALGAPLRADDLPRLQALGPLGDLLARQSVAYGADAGMAALGAAYPGLPDDLVNIHWDPLACAVALGWQGAEVAEQRLSPVLEEGVLRFVADAGGTLMRVVTHVDGAAFSATWLDAVSAAAASASASAR